jgi:hypothetical protein
VTCQSKINFESLVDSNYYSSRIIRPTYIKRESDEIDSEEFMDIPDENTTELS